MALNFQTDMTDVYEYDIYKSKLHEDSEFEYFEYSQGNGIKMCTRKKYITHIYYA